MLACNKPIVQIVFREDFGTDGRGGYFDQYGYVGNNVEVLMLSAFSFNHICFKLKLWCKISVIHGINLSGARFFFPNKCSVHE